MHDFSAEAEIYEQTPTLIPLLQQWEGESMGELYEYLCKEEFLQSEELVLQQAWERDLDKARSRK